MNFIIRLLDPNFANHAKYKKKKPTKICKFNELRNMGPDFQEVSSV